MSDLQAMVGFGLLAALFNLGLTMLNLKLYTEFAKQRMQEDRKLKEWSDSK